MKIANSILRGFLQTLDDREIGELLVLLAQEITQRNHDAEEIFTAARLMRRNGDLQRTLRRSLRA